MVSHFNQLQAEGVPPAYQGSYERLGMQNPELDALYKVLMY
jgi:hypothetical protein